jgi:hypothetical protein
VSYWAVVFDAAAAAAARQCRVQLQLVWQGCNWTRNLVAGAEYRYITNSKGGGLMREGERVEVTRRPFAISDGMHHTK